MFKCLVSTLLTSALCIPSAAQAVDGSGAVSVPIDLIGSSNKCINANKSLVSLWLTSITVETKNSWLTSTASVGAQADIKLSSSTEGEVSFPRAGNLSTVNIGGSLVRGGLMLNLLSQQMVDKNTNMIQIPVTLLKTKGDTALAKYSRALIKFSADAVKVIPPNPYSPGIATAGKLATTFLDVAKLNDDGVEAPNFRIGHEISRNDDCQPLDLTDGVHVLISDASKVQPGVVKTADLNKYCFYLSGPTLNREVRYIARPISGPCASAEPAGLTTRLDNPQVIYAVTAVPRNQQASISAALISDALVPVGSTTSPLHTLRAESINKLRKNGEIKQALDVCAEVGLTEGECLSGKQPSAATPLIDLE